LENGTFAFQFVAQQIGVNQIAVVRDCHLPAHAIDHEGLRILQRARSGGGITGMPDRARPFQFLQLFLSENLGNQPHALMLEEGLTRAVARDDARTLLSTMLQREQPVISQNRRIRMTKYTKEPALMLRECFAFWQFLVLGESSRHGNTTSSISRLGSIRASQARDRFGIAFHGASDRVPPEIVKLGDLPVKFLVANRNAEVVSNHAAYLRMRNIVRFQFGQNSSCILRIAGNNDARLRLAEKNGARHLCCRARRLASSLILLAAGTAAATGR